MKTKKLWLVMAACALIIAAIPSKKSQAQNARFGIKGGLNLSDMKYEPRDNTNGVPDSKSLTSFHVGAFADVPLIGFFYVQPGVMLNSVGSKASFHSDALGDYTQKINPFYVDVPVNFLFEPEIGPDSRFYAGVGPYIGFGVGGKVKFNANTPLGEGNVDHDIEFGNKDGDDLKKTDIGGNVLAGFELGHLLLGAQYGLSFTNNAPKGDNSDSKILRNKVFSVSVGYVF